MKTIQDLRIRVEALASVHYTHPFEVRWNLVIDILNDIVTFLEQREPLAPKRLGRYEGTAKKYGRKGKASNP